MGRIEAFSLGLEAVGHYPLVMREDKPAEGRSE